MTPGPHPRGHINGQAAGEDGVSGNWIDNRTGDRMQDEGYGLCRLSDAELDKVSAGCNTVKPDHPKAVPHPTPPHASSSPAARVVTVTVTWRFWQVIRFL
ncbi:hypothetical protein [Rhodovastum atsumiense]|uniref:Uncharacterized protein n=1 Tax=Rhodovastum atsumiense TaxID=504468 RepID=A0A5M6IZX0_9PROT|nr:hypothetical protein [Rhodovastum atsumiense]KAA5613853.1 hypothetical protein F1189_03505 [Rhodovastum atsumiense]